MFDTDSILPPPPDGDLAVLHDREYRVRAFRGGSDRLLIQGAVRDQKPPGLYIADDPDPLTIHHMQVTLEVGFPSLEIVGAQVHFEQHPRDECPRIVDHYDNIVGLSIARGFISRVRDLFGGPRGCTHTTALLQAMAPVAVQCFWSMLFAADGANDPGARPASRRANVSETDMWKRHVNSCHVWDEHGTAVANRLAGEPEPIPVFLRQRLEALGPDAIAQWS